MNAQQIIDRYRAGERDFRRLNLQGMNFEGMDFSGADFSECQLQGTNFQGATLRGTNFTQVEAGLQKPWVVLFLLLLVVVAMVGSWAQGLMALVPGSGFGGTVSGGLETRFSAIAGGGLWLLVVWVIWRQGWAVGLVVFGLMVAGGIFSAIAWVGAFSVALIFAGAFTIVGAIAFGILFTGALGLGSFGVATLVFLVIFAIAWGGGGGFVVASLAAGGALFSGWWSWQTWRSDRGKIWLDWFFWGRGGRTSFRGADLTEANFSGAFLQYGDFREATLHCTYFRGAKALDQARLGNSYLRDGDLRQLLRSGRWAGNPEGLRHRGDLSGLALQGCELVGIDFTGSDLSHSNLSQANLTDSNLTDVRLNHGNLTGANLTRADLRGTQLHHGDLTAAQLTGACVAQWQVTAETVFQDVRCDYLYVGYENDHKCDRLPRDHQRNFAPEEFQKELQTWLQTQPLPPEPPPATTPNEAAPDEAPGQ